MTKKLSFKAFVISQVLILITGLLFVGGLYYMVNSSSLPGQPKISTLGSGGPVTKEPASLTLDLTTPDEDSLVFKDSIEFSGKTSPDSQVLITRVDFDVILESKNDGTFSGDFDLEEGVNEIRVVVFDQNGDQKELERTVYYSKEKI